MPTSTAPPKNLDNLIDNIALTGFPGDAPLVPKQQQHKGEHTTGINPTDGHRNFFFEDKTYAGVNGEKKTIRTMAVHDFIPTINPNDLMGPRKPGGKINYDDFSIYDPKRHMGGGFSYGAPSDTLRPSPVKDTPAAIAIPVVKPAPAAAKPAPLPQPAAKPAPATPKDDGAPVEIVIPKWTKGPPTTNEEIEEYKKFMVAKYEAEAKQNAEILRQRKLKEGK